MCNFAKQNADTKLLIAMIMKKFAQSLGGANALLTLVESMRAHKPHPLLEQKCSIKSKYATISWNKKILEEKKRILESFIFEHKSKEGAEINIMLEQNQKKKKEIINLVKALGGVDFIVKSSSVEGGGFEFKLFEKSDLENEEVTLNPLFVALFFCSVDYAKQALKYEV